MKKNIYLTLAACFVSVLAFSQAHVNGKITDSLSYALGVNVYQSLKNVPAKIDIESFVKAVEQSHNNVAQMTEEESVAFIGSYFNRVNEFEYNDNVAKGERFLADNKTKEGVVELPSGLQYLILKEGTGANPAEDDEVEVHYKGTLLDGTEFDSSYSRGEPITFPLNRVIPGWTEGVQHVKEGGKIKLFIPSDLAYGKREMTGSAITPGSTLIFEIELLKIIKK